MLSVQFKNISSVSPQCNPQLKLRDKVNLRAQESRDIVSFGNNIKSVMLRTGIEEAEPLVKVTMMSLHSLAEQGLPGMLALYDLAAKCQNPSYKFFGKAEQTLKALALVQEDGQIHNSIKNIVRAASEGEGLDFRLVNPLTGK